MRRGQNPRTQKPKEEIPEIYLSEDACLLCSKYCYGKNDNRLICQPCSEQVDKLKTKLSLIKSKLTEWKSLTQDRIKSPLIRLFDED